MYILDCRVWNAKFTFRIVEFRMIIKIFFKIYLKRNYGGAGRNFLTHFLYVHILLKFFFKVWPILLTQYFCCLSLPISIYTTWLLKAWAHSCGPPYLLFNTHFLYVHCYRKDWTHLAGPTNLLFSELAKFGAVSLAPHFCYLPPIFYIYYYQWLLWKLK